MKKKIIALLICICMTVAAMAVAMPVYAAGGDAADGGTEDDAHTYYYDRMSDRVKWCYEWLKDYYDNMTGEPGEYHYDLTYLIPGGTQDDYDELWHDFLMADTALRSDQPLYTWKGEISGGSWNMIGEAPVFILYITHFNVLTEDSTKQAEARIAQIVETVGEGDRYTKLRKMTSYILSNAFYDPHTGQINEEGHRFFGLETRGHFYDIHSYGLLLKNIAICSGFSAAVKVLCDELDIPCIIIGNKGHAWNLVQMEDGGWYRLDITNNIKLGWDGEEQSLDDYFNLTFLNNDELGDYSDPYMVSVPKREPVRDFPELAEGMYQYTGETTDFSYVEAQSTYVPGEPTFSYTVNADGKTCTIYNFEGKEEGDLIIPEKLDGYTVTAIEDYTFYYCTGFTGRLVIPDTVEKIGDVAFGGCYNLTEIKLPEKLRSIGKAAFIGCKALTSVELPDLLNSVGQYAFYDCSSLESVSFGSHILSVDADAFASCAPELTVSAPDGSAAYQYAVAHEVAFVELGELCGFVDVDGEWEYNNDGHFHTCEHDGRFDIEAHSNQTFSCGTRCEVCNAQGCLQLGMFCESVEVRVNAKPATCNEPEFLGDVQCICGNPLGWGEYVGDPTFDHKPETDDWYSDEIAHWQLCECGQTINTDMHTGGTATVTDKPVCEVCGASYGETLHVHSEYMFGYFDDVSHYIMCNCGEYMGTAPHTGGVATENELALCDICHSSYGDFARPEDGNTDAGGIEQVTDTDTETVTDAYTEAETDESVTNEPTTDGATETDGTESTEKGTDRVETEGDTEESVSQEVTEETTEETTEGATEDADASDDSRTGCGSTLGGGAILIAIVAIGGFAMAKRREE